MSLPHTFFIGRSGGGSEYGHLTIQVNATFASTSNSFGNSTGGTLAQYQTASTNGNSSQILSRMGDGILHLKAKAGTYNYEARSAFGSGATSYGSRQVTGTMTFATDMDLLLLVPNHGTGPYSGGGGFFLASANDPDNITHTDMTSANAILVIGGGGGGYAAWNSEGAPGPVVSGISNANVQRNGGYNTASQSYDAGAGFLNTGLPHQGSGSTSTGYSGATKPHHFVQGGRGSLSGTCGTNGGGFGGGGGSCPGGGGGYVGGGGGVNSGSFGGGGGTSYFNTSIVTISSGQNTSIPGHTNNLWPTSAATNKSGYFKIY